MPAMLHSEFFLSGVSPKEKRHVEPEAWSSATAADARVGSPSGPDASARRRAIASVGASAASASCDAAFMPLASHAPALPPTSASIVRRACSSAASFRASNVPQRPYSGGTGFAASQAALTWR